MRSSPAEAAERIFGCRLWQAQKDVLKAFFENRKVTVKTCHGIGKTFTLGRGVPLYLLSHAPSRVVTTAPTNKQVEEILWGEINEAWKRLRIKPPKGSRCLNMKLEIEDKWDAIGFHTDNPMNFQGWHSPNMAVIVDEAGGVDRDTFDMLSTLLTSQDAKRVYIGNPDDPTGVFFESHLDPEFVKLSVDAFSTPNFTRFGITYEDIAEGTWRKKVTESPPYPYLITPEWVEDAYRNWGPESPMFRSKVLAEFPDTSVEQLIPLSAMEAAVRKKPLTQGELMAEKGQFGLDVARFGDDLTVLAYRRGPMALYKWKFNRLSTREVAEWVRGLTHKIDPKAVIVVDGVGIGAGVIDNLREWDALRGKVYEYSGAKKAGAKEEFYNLKAEWYWSLRERLIKGEIFGRFDEVDKYELCSLKYRYVGGKVRIERKEQTKARIGRSPDAADAWMLAFAPVQATSRVKTLLAKAQRRIDEVLLDRAVAQG